jgi:hypothetical protein
MNNNMKEKKRKGRVRGCIARGKKKDVLLIFFFAFSYEIICYIFAIFVALTIKLQALTSSIRRTTENVLEENKIGNTHCEANFRTIT